MFKKRKSCLATVTVISLIGLLSFKDTGIFVTEFVASGEDGSEVAFKAEESVNILKERDREFIVERDRQKYQIPKDAVLLTEKSSNSYIVNKENTRLMDKPGGRIIKGLNIGDEVQLDSIQEEYGYIITTDNVKGYILLKDLEAKNKEETFTIGTSTINKTVKGKNNTYYVLAKGESVLIKDFKNGKFIIVDEDGKEIQVPKSYISLKNSRQTASRSALSRRTSRLNAVIQKAHQEIGRPYRSSGTGKNGYDCSGLTYSLYLNNAGIELNRSSRDQVKNGVAVKKSELIPGDIVFFRTSGRGIGHVGLYIGDGNMIHASSGSKKVVITPIDSKWYKQRYVTARRIIN